jgi:hypothetical protein
MSIKEFLGLSKIAAIGVFPVFQTPGMSFSTPLTFYHIMLCQATTRPTLVVVHVVQLINSVKIQMSYTIL